MDYPNEDSKSLYDYSDKSVQHAGYAAIVYGVVNLFGAVLALIKYFLFHRPGPGDGINHDFASQQYLLHTPLVTALAVIFTVVIAALAGVLAFFIFRRSRVAVVAMLILVVALQLYAWLGARSIAGSIVSIIVVAFLLRGARRIFQDHAEGQMERAEEV